MSFEFITKIGLLQSLGWRVVRFWVYELRENLPRCVQHVVSLLNK